MSQKNVTQRVQECVRIQRELRDMGYMTVDANRRAVQYHMNRFIQSATPSTFDLVVPGDRPGNKTSVVLSMTRTSHAVRYVAS